MDPEVKLIAVFMDKGLVAGWQCVRGELIMSGSLAGSVFVFRSLYGSENVCGLISSLDALFFEQDIPLRVTSADVKVTIEPREPVECQASLTIGAR